MQRLNDKGGINGKKIDLVSVDYGYKIPRGGRRLQAAGQRREGRHDQRLGHRRHRGPEEPGQRRQDPLRLGIVLRGADRHLQDAVQLLRRAELLRPAARLAQVGARRLGKKSGNPKLAFFYGDNAYGKSPIEAGRRYAKEIGIDVVDEEILPAPSRTRPASSST